MDIVSIKLFKNDIECADYHDIMIDEYDKKVAELHKYGEKINKKIIFTISNNINSISGDCFAEITTNCTLTKQEKEYLVDIIKFFCGDAEISNKTMEIKTKPVTVLFSQKQFDDIYEV